MFKIRNLLKIYSTERKKKIILNNINFTLPNKGMYFIYGKSGCGKSTLLNILEGIGEIDNGEVIYDGIDLYKISNKEKEKLFKNNFGILFQSFNLIEYLTVIENLDLTMNIKGSEDENYVIKLLKKYNILNLKDQLVSSLSGGEKQRLSLVRALLNKPQVLFADEPTGALDSTNSYLMLNYLKELSKDILIVIVTHNMDLIKNYSDGNIHIKRGLIDVNYKNKEDKKIIKKENKKSKDYSKFFLRKKIKKNIKTDIFGAISMFFGTIFVCLFLGFFIGFNKSYDNIQFSYMNYNLFSISQMDYQESGNEHINIVRKIRPKLDFIEEYFCDIENKEILNSYDSIIGNEKFISANNQKIKDFNISFYYEKSDLNYIYINDIFLNEFPFMKNMIGSQIDVNIKKELSIFNFEKNEFIKDDFEFEEGFVLKEIKNEFIYLNSKKVYLPYKYFTSFLLNYYPTNYNKDVLGKKNLYNIINDSTNTEEINGLNYIMYVDNIKDYQKLLNLMEKQDSKAKIRIEQNNYHLLKSFKEIVNIFIEGANIFLGIIILSNIFLISFLSYYSYINSIKENAILKVLGSSDKSIYKIYLLEQLLFGGSSSLLGVLVSSILIAILNNVIYSFISINSLFYCNFILFLSVLITFLVIVICSSLLPFLFNKKINIAKELMEE